MLEVKAVYEGQKHCEVTHGPSGAQIQTDAPKDNHGLGALFSPTDLVAAAISTCTLTVMAIWAEQNGIDLKGSTCRAEKHMGAGPRRIVQLPLEIHFPKSVPESSRGKLEEIAMTCPVKQSLHPSLETPMKFYYDL